MLIGYADLLVKAASPRPNGRVRDQAAQFF
jgi:hypothetical protein